MPILNNDPAAGQAQAAGGLWLTCNATPLLQQLYSQFLLLQAARALISVQPSFDLKLIQTLPQDQALLLRHVESFTQTLAPQILGVFQSFISAAAAFRNFGAELTTCAVRLDTMPLSDPSYADILSTFDAILEQLQRVIADTHVNKQSLGDALALVKTSLDFFCNQAADDQSLFQATINSVTASQEIAQLQTQLADLQSSIDSVNSSIAKGAAAALPEIAGFTIALGAAAMGEVASMQVAINLAVAVPPEAQQATGDASAWQAQYSELDDLTRQYLATAVTLADEKQQYAVLITLANQADAFLNALNGAQTALQDLIAEVGKLASGFARLGTLTAPSDSSGTFFQNQVSGAVAYWSSVSDDCGKWLDAADSVVPQ